MSRHLATTLLALLLLALPSNAQLIGSQWEFTTSRSGKKHTAIIKFRERGRITIVSRVPHNCECPTHWSYSDSTLSLKYIDGKTIPYKVSGDKTSLSYSTQVQAWSGRQINAAGDESNSYKRSSLGGSSLGRSKLGGAKL